MKCQILFSGKNKKNISKCRLLKILPRGLSVKVNYTISATLPKLLFFHYQMKQNIFMRNSNSEAVIYENFLITKK